MSRSKLGTAALALACIAAFAALPAVARQLDLRDQSLPTPAPTPLDDPTIIAIFDAANTADIETGSLAAERGSSREVRDYAAMLVRDHLAVRKLGRDLAARLGVTPTPPADDPAARAHGAAMKSLRALRGAAFDRAFLAHEAQFHRNVIDAVETTLLPAIRNEELKALVAKVAPAFQAHMLAAEHLAGKLAAE